MQLSPAFATIYNTLQEPVLLAIRFFLLAGAIYLFLYVWKRDKYWFNKIQQRYPGNKHIWYEIKYSFFTCVIFGLVLIWVTWASKMQYTLIYRPIDKYGYGYYVFSIFLVIFVHDAYFYWTHRLLHWKPLFKKVHRVHHHSINPTPFAAYCFHPVEALFQIGIVPLVVFTIPYHVTVIYIFTGYTLLLNIMGHSGYEFFSKAVIHHKIAKWHNSATHHNMHHKLVKFNYGLYFNIWDRLMKTNHPNYEEYFDTVIEQRELDKINIEIVINNADNAEFKNLESS